jgi:hypothetical protein
VYETVNVPSGLDAAGVVELINGETVLEAISAPAISAETAFVPVTVTENEIGEPAQTTFAPLSE